METVLPKLFFLYNVQRKVFVHLYENLKKQGQHELLNLNTFYLWSLLTPEQKKYWKIWVSEIESSDVYNYATSLEQQYNVISPDPNPRSSHLEEYISPRKSVLIYNNSHEE